MVTPVAPAHCDLTMANVILGRSALTLVDWESASDEEPEPDVEPEPDAAKVD